MSVALCPHVAACGSCSFQDIPEADYRALKTARLEKAVEHSGYALTPEPILFLPASTRRRATFKVQNNKLAYAQKRSHQLVAIERCLILTPELQAFLPPLQEALRTASPAPESIQITQADSGIDVVIEGAWEWAGALPVARISVKVDEKITTVVRNSAVTVKRGAANVALPPGAFLQAAKEGEAALLDFVEKAVAGEKRIADLFCGLGTYALPLSQKSAVHAVDSDKGMMQALAKAAPKLSVETRNLFQNPLKADELNRFDAMVLNPPRAGAEAQVKQLAASYVPVVAMVSCNPETFARDAAILRQGGYRMTRILGVDQFVFSEHLEIAAHFAR